MRSGVGTGFAWFSRDMTGVKVLFGDITALRNEKGKLVVMRGEQRLSPYEYDEVHQLSPKCWALRRDEPQKWDLVFENGRMEFGYQFVYLLPKKGGRKRKQRLIGIQFPNGTGVVDDSGNFLAFIPERHRIVVVRDRFLVVLPDSSSGSYVRVYSLYGDILAEGEPNQALTEACQKVKLIYGWHDICNVSRRYDWSLGETIR